MEEWRDVVGYEGLYQVNNVGDVRSVDRHNERGYCIKGKIMEQRKDKDGYSIVVLRKDKQRKFRKVHRLVAQAFVLNYDNLPCVNHKNEIKDDNRAENLEWCTIKYNNSYGTRNERISKAQKGRANEHCKGERNFFYGKHFSRGLHPKAKKVNQFQKDGKFIRTFDCVGDAAESINVTDGAISMACRGERQYIGGYVWKYVE